MPRGRGRPLHVGGHQHQLAQRVAPPQDVGDVAPHHAHRRGHHPDPPRPARQRPLARVLEQALGRQLGAQLLVALVQVAGAGGRQGRDVQLVDALRLVGAQPPVDDHLHPVLGPHVGHGQLLAEEHRPDLALRVLQGEEAMARWWKRGLADLALDPDVGQRRIAVQQLAHAAIEVARRAGCAALPGRLAARRDPSVRQALRPPVAPTGCVARRSPIGPTAGA